MKRPRSTTARSYYTLLAPQKKRGIKENKDYVIAHLGEKGVKAAAGRAFWNV